ncbi:MAG: DUF4838 domain-containing protein, partial [Planctomycetota bacterium]
MLRSSMMILTLLSLSTSVGAGFLLVDTDAGVEPAPLVLFPGAPPKTRAAAVELADYIERITGLRPVLFEDLPQPIPKRAIWLGYQPALEDIFPDTNFEFQHAEETMIRISDDYVVIAGRDRWDPDHLTAFRIDREIVGIQSEYGTVNAIYTFLQDNLDVRWFWPGELGEDVPQRRRVVLPLAEIRYHPQLRARGGLFNFSALGNKGYGRAQDWSRRQRLQLDSLRIGGGHAFNSWHDRFIEKSPELFALQPDGSRGTYPPNSRNVKLCQSNPDVWSTWLADVEEILKSDPTRKEFSAASNDGWMSGHCVCARCRSWDHPDGESREMVWRKHKEFQPALSDRHVTFANKLAALLQESYPNQNYSVTMLAYGHARPEPVKARPADNLIVVSVANFFGRGSLADRGSPSGTTHREQYKSWSEVSSRLVWRPNTGSPAGWQQGLPDLSIRQTINDLKFVAENKAVGIIVDAVWEHWSTQGPQYYAMAQLVWNPSKDGAAILDDYYRRAFGPAAEHVRRYYESIESARMAYVTDEGYKAGTESLHKLFTNKLLDQLEDTLRQARAAVKNTPGVYRQRVDFVGAGFDYTKL